MSVELNERRQLVLGGGGEDRVAKQHEAGKLTARERVNKLFDEGSFVETGVFTAAKEGASSVIRIARCSSMRRISPSRAAPWAKARPRRS